MKNFISTVYIRTNAISDEKICVGLFIGSEEKAYFSWSENKLKLTTKLLSEDVYSSLMRTFKNLEKDISEKTIECKNSQTKLFKSLIYSSKFFDYLSKYDKGLIEFKEPKTLSHFVNESEFLDLFRLYVGEENKLKETHTFKESLYQKVKTYLNKPTFKEKADIQFSPPNKIVESVYTTSKLDFISCNGNIFAGNAIDFTTKADTIADKLYEFRAMVEGLTGFAAKHNFKGRGKYVAYFNQPLENDQKAILNKVRKDSSKLFELKEVEEMEEAAEQLSKHNYRKFSSVLEEIGA